MCVLFRLRIVGMMIGWVAAMYGVRGRLRTTIPRGALVRIQYII